MEAKPKTEAVAGRNPVLELLRSQRELECVYLQKGLEKGPVGRIVALAKERGVPVKETTAEKLQALSGISSHQGVAAVLSAAAYSRMEDIFRRAGEEPLFLVLADGIEDPHNLGAIIRTAEGAGAHGVIIPKRHSAGLTAAAVKTAAGAAAHWGRASSTPSSLRHQLDRGRTARAFFSQSPSRKQSPDWRRASPCWPMDRHSRFFQPFSP